MMETKTTQILGRLSYHRKSIHIFVLFLCYFVEDVQHYVVFIAEDFYISIFLYIIWVGFLLLFFLLLLLLLLLPRESKVNSQFGTGLGVLQQ